MTRAARLLSLIQALREHRRPVTGRALAERIGVSLRTLYRDIATLQAEGAPIEGEPGLGYVLRPGFALPPLMFDADEVDALMLGLRFTRRRGDPALSEAADRALAKIEAVLPPALASGAAASPLLAGTARGGGEALAVLRDAMRREVKVSLAYTDKKGRPSDRLVWPVAIGFFDGGDMLAAWCESRDDFRHFRLDRVRGATPLDERLPRRHAVLLAEWRLSEKLDEGR